MSVHGGTEASMCEVCNRTKDVSNAIYCARLPQGQMPLPEKNVSHLSRPTKWLTRHYWRIPALHMSHTDIHHSALTADLSPRTTASQHIPFTFPPRSSRIIKWGVESVVKSLSSMESVTATYHMPHFSMTVQELQGRGRTGGTKCTSHVCSIWQFRAAVGQMGQRNEHYLCLWW